MDSALYTNLLKVFLDAVHPNAVFIHNLPKPVWEQYMHTTGRQWARAYQFIRVYLRPTLKEHFRVVDALHLFSD